MKIRLDEGTEYEQVWDRHPDHGLWVCAQTGAIAADADAVYLDRIESLEEEAAGLKAMFPVWRAWEGGPFDIRVFSFQVGLTTQELQGVPRRALADLWAAHFREGFLKELDAV